MNHRLAGFALAACAVLPVQAAGLEASAVLRRAESVMGAAGLKTLRYAGTGSAWQFGQAYKPGPWPKLNLASYARLVDYDKAAWREDVVRSRAEPNGGGAVPLSGEQRLSMALSGAHAWNLAGPAPAPALVLLPAGFTTLDHTHGIVRGAKNSATLQFRTQAEGKSPPSPLPTRPVFRTAFINEDYVVERVESRMPTRYLATPGRHHYEGYRTLRRHPVPDPHPAERRRQTRSTLR